MIDFFWIIAYLSAGTGLAKLVFLINGPKFDELNEIDQAGICVGILFWPIALAGAAAASVVLLSYYLLRKIL